MRPSEVAKSLEELTKESEEEQRIRIERWTEWGLSYLTPENLQYAIDSQTDPVTLFGNHFKLNSWIVKPFAKIVFRAYWKEMEPLLTDARKLYKILVKDPTKKKMLDTPEGRHYVNWCVSRYYSFLYNYCWR